jgi:trehalose 6-phosphate synthase
MPNWNKDRLIKTIREQFSGARLVVVSNREPYLHYRAPDGKIKARRSVGGVSISFDSILKATRGLWVAYGGSDADRDAVNEHDEVRLPPGSERYTLKRVWMNRSELDGYYNGFSNETLWPLCHVAFVKPSFNPADWRYYSRINRRFAEKTLETLDDGRSVVWIQDYHFALLPRLLRKQRPDLVIGQFWHIPWPTYEIFRICPWKRDILEGMLGNDVIGFHRSFHARNFLDAVSRELEANVDFDGRTIKYKGRQTSIIVQPVGVDAQDIDDRLARLEDRSSSVIQELPHRPEILAVGVDRIDYTKGIPRRLHAIDRFLERHPDYLGRFSYVGIGSPSRTAIASYRSVMREVERTVAQINAKYRTKRWQPIHYLPQFIDRNDTLMLLREANLCLVTSLDDGMNLVAKEFVTANRTNGALILSEFTGAANDLREAILVNPYDDEALSESIRTAIELPQAERARRLAAMRRRVSENNLFRWAGKFLLKLADAVRTV